MICDAMIRKPKKVATRLGNFGELLYNVAPKASDAILNTAYKLFPESKAAKGEEAKKDGSPRRRRSSPPRASPSVPDEGGTGSCARVLREGAP